MDSRVGVETMQAIAEDGIACDRIGRVQTGQSSQQSTDRRQCRQGVSQGGQFARSRGTQGNPGADPFEVHTQTERLCQGFVNGQQPLDGLMSASTFHGLTQGVLQPLPHQATACSRAALIHAREQRGCSLAPQGLQQFEVATRRDIERDPVGAVKDPQMLQMRGRPALRSLNVEHQRTCRPDRGRQRVEFVADPHTALRVAAEPLTGPLHIELPFRQALQGCERQTSAYCGSDLGSVPGCRAQPDVGRWSAAREICRCMRRGAKHGVLSHQNLGRVDALEFGFKLAGGDLGNPASSACDIHPGQGDPVLACGMQGEQGAIFALRQQRGIGQRARRDNANHLALHGPLACGRITDLLAEGDRLAHTDQSRKILLGSMKRHTRHADRLAIRGASPGERDPQQSRSLICIVLEQLVEIPHAIKEQCVGMVSLDAQVLLHHRCVTREVFSAIGRTGV